MEKIKLQFLYSSNSMNTSGYTNKELNATEILLSDPNSYTLKYIGLGWYECTMEVDYSILEELELLHLISESEYYRNSQNNENNQNSL
jgi:hypothetical protein